MNGVQRSSDDAQKRIFCPVRDLDEELYVAGRATSDGAYEFWIERPQGRLWMHLSQPAAGCKGIDLRREIVALTWDDPMLVRVAMKTGWFTRTGREVAHPANERNEVWALSESCLQLFSNGHRPIHAPPPALGGALGEVVQAPEHGDVTLQQVLHGLMIKLKQVGVTCVVVTTPDPWAKTGGRRLMVAAFPETLRKSAVEFELPSDSAPTGELAQWGYLENMPERRWSKLMHDHGFKTAVIVRVPVAGEHYYEFLMFGTSRLYDQAQAAVGAWSALNIMPQLKAAVASSICALTPRERLCLLSASQSKTAVETAEELGCTPRTVRLHLSNVMSKLRTASTIGAFQRAQMLGIL